MNLGGLDLNLLVALDALLSERSVTRAAQRVGLSQPGMSNALGRLRRLLNDPLLVRQGATLVPTARAEALIGPVHEALELIRRALDAPLRFDPATDRRSFRLSCSDYSVLMLIGPLVRALAADAPGVVVEVLPRLADAGRALLNGDVDLVIEPPEIMGDTDLESLRLWDDRWECCVWEGNTRVGERMTMERYTALGHLIYSMGGAGQPVALPDLHLGAPRRPAAHRGQRRELPARALPAAGHGPGHAHPQASRGVPSPHRRHPSARVADRTARARRNALVALARDRRPGPRMAAHADRRGREHAHQPIAHADITRVAA